MKRTPKKAMNEVKREERVVVIRAKQRTCSWVMSDNDSEKKKGAAIVSQRPKTDSETRRLLRQLVDIVFDPILIGVNARRVP